MENQSLKQPRLALNLNKTQQSYGQEKKLQDQWQNVKQICCLKVVNEEKENEILPLKLVEFNVDINNSLAQVSQSQHYLNDSNQILDTELHFSINPKSAFHSLQVIMGDQIIKGVIREKEQAKQEYLSGVQNGKTIAFSEIDQNSPELMKLKLGNLLPQKEAIIVFTYVEELEVCMNKFWKLSLVMTTRPKIKPSYKPLPSQMCNQLINFISPKNNNVSNLLAFRLAININITSVSSINFLKSPTHQIKQKITQENGYFKAFIQLDDQSNYTPNSDFMLLYCNQQTSNPSVSIGKMGNVEYPYCAQITFIPDYNHTTIDDAYKAYIEDNNLESNDFSLETEDQRAEFIFVIDRSGSMEGIRIKKAVEALILFIKSLPMDCYYQVYSFGSNYRTLFQESQKVNQQIITYSINTIYNFQADMGGTEIFQPLQDIYLNTQIKTNYPRRIFLLTDGDVSNAKQVINLIQNNSNPNSSLYTLGIGSGCSRYLITFGANFGGGLFEFVSDEEDLNKKVMTLLDHSISPYVTDIQLNTKECQTVSAIIPDPSTMRGLKKNEPFTFYLLLGKTFSDCENSNLLIFQDEILELTYQFNNSSQQKTKLNLSQVQIKQTDAYHKIAISDLIKKSILASQYEQETSPILFKQLELLDEKQLINLSIKYNVLCELTAFLCEISDNQEDSTQQLLQNIKKRKIIFPIISSEDFAQKQRAIEKTMLLNSNQNLQTNVHQSQVTSLFILLQKQLDLFSFSCNAQVSNSNFSKQTKANNLLDLLDFDQPKSNKFQEQQQNFNSSSHQSSSIYIKIIVKQNITGLFEMDNELLSYLNLSQQLVIQSIPQILQQFQNKNDLWITVLVIQWLEKNQKNEKGAWNLAIKKSFEFLKKLGVDYSNLKQQAIKIV